MLWSSLQREWHVAVVARVFTGALLSVCSCGVVPLGLGIFRSGVSRGTTLIFMVSTPAISPVSVLLVMNLLGVNYTLLYFGIVLLGAFLIGLLGNRLSVARLTIACAPRHLVVLPRSPVCPVGLSCQGVKAGHVSRAQKICTRPGCVPRSAKMV